MFQVVEQNNFAVSEFINNKRAESNFEPIKNRVSKTVSCINMFRHLYAGSQVAVGVQ